MKSSFYVIIGPDDGGQNQQYWNAIEWEWTSDFGAATRYDGHVFFMPLPPGVDCIEEFSSDNRPIGYHKPGYPPSWEGSFSL